MLHLILPAPLHRQALRLAHGLRKRWWRWFRPRLAGCSAIVRNPEGHVLLVRHSYGSGRWALPGGGVARGEDPAVAIRREIGEETGCALVELEFLGRVEEDLHGARNGVHLFAALTHDTPLADGRELLEVRFFALDALPDGHGAAVRGRIAHWLTATKADRP